MSDGNLGINVSGIKKTELTKFRKEITNWLVVRSNEEIEAMARFLSFFFGGLAGAMSKTIVAPLERIKVIIQT